MAARSSLLRRPTPGAHPARRTSSVVAALAALAPRLVRLAHHDYPDGLLGMRLEVGFQGRVEYGRALAWQEALVARRLAGGPDALLLLEHPPVYTLGRGADARFLGAAAARGVPGFRAHCGGPVTYHGPGPLVGYPIVRVPAFRPGLRLDPRR